MSLESHGNDCFHYPHLLTHIYLDHQSTGRQHYRLYTINKIPTLKVLDFQKVKQSEKDKAQRLARSAAGAALESDVQIEARDSSAKSKTFTPGEGKSAKESFVVNFTSEQKAKIKEMIANASSPMEIERIEECVRRGKFPGDISDAGEKLGDEEKKRPHEEVNGESKSKRSRPS